MEEMIEYLNSICKVISDKYTFPIYIEEVPDEFKRPSFFVQVVAGDSEELSKDIYRDNVTFQIVFFSELNEFQSVDVEKQLLMFTELRKLFLSGFLSVVGTDRVAKITGVRTAKRTSEIYIDLDLSLARDRVEEDIIKDGVFDVMKELYINNEGVE